MLLYVQVDAKHDSSGQPVRQSAEDRWQGAVAHEKLTKPPPINVARTSTDKDAGSVIKKAAPVRFAALTLRFADSGKVIHCVHQRPTQR